MKVPLTWLADYVDITLSVDALAHRLSMAGAEVGAVERAGGDWDRVHVGLVTALDPHPNADRLRLATVDFGGAEPQTVVCGAPNVALGQKIAFAQEGARLFDGHSGEPITLKRSKIRGVVSAGMVCSERELGLSDQHEGILVLDEGLTVGAPLADVLGETVLDITPTPNRPDHLSILGIAREVAALTGQALREPDAAYPAEGPPVRDGTSVEILDPDLCPRYVASIIRGIEVRPSPDWIQQRLLAAGQRPINNVVDVTNFVMLEMGQPLHAFDFDCLQGSRIVVRRPRPGERIRLLDGSDHSLSPDHLLIADAQGAVAVAGVMGGAESEVSPTTANILLEAANFHPGALRRTAAALRQRTEASLRFEKGLNPELATAASARAMRLLLATAGGGADAGIVDAYPGKTPSAPVHLSQRRLTQIAGVDLPRDEVRTILTGLGFGLHLTDDGYDVRPPYWRTDVAIADDVVEEVARIKGYDNLPSLGLPGALPDPERDPLRETREAVRDALAALGCAEAITYAAVSETALAALPGPAQTVEALALLNPMSQEHACMRTSLRTGLLTAYAANAPRGRARPTGPVQLFEAGKVFLPRGPADLPDERLHLLIVAGGATAPSPHDTTVRPLDLFDLKGLLDGVAASLRLRFEYASPSGPDLALLPGLTATVSVPQGQGKRRRLSAIGVVGRLDPALAGRFDIEDDVFLAEIDLTALATLETPPVRVGTLSRFPLVVEDLAVVVDEDTPAAAVAAILTRPGLVERADLFDLYRGPPVAQGKVSLAYSVTYRADDRTLTDDEVAKVRGGIVKQLQRELAASIREA